MNLSMGRIGFSSTSVSPRRLAHFAGAAAFVATLFFWGEVLRAPHAQPPSAPVADASNADPASEVVAAWLGPGDVRLDVKVLGVARREDGRAVALLSVNGAPPKAMMAGESLMDNVVLQAIANNDVTLAHGDSRIRLAAPRRKEDNGAGIVRAP